ncbi:MAG: hypothetical protein IKZ82_13085 [Clostridia bacterium]|nr:hypothetical protein [Clostridia bacterium]
MKTEKAKPITIACIALAALSALLFILLLTVSAQKREAETRLRNHFDSLLASAKDSFERYLETGEERHYYYGASDIGSIAGMYDIKDDAKDSIDILLHTAHGRLIDCGAKGCRDALPYLIEGLDKALEGNDASFNLYLQYFRNHTDND